MSNDQGHRLPSQADPDFTQQKIYVSGPMRGYPDFNFPAFNAKTELLRSMGHFVYNPAENFDGDTSLPRSVYMRHDYRLISEATAIVMLAGWKDSPGAMIELLMAQEIGLLCYNQDLYQFTPGISICVSDDLFERGNILEDAARIVDGPRRSTYGHPYVNHNRTAQFWNTYLSKYDKNFQITAEDVCEMMVLQKTARQMNADHRDNHIDRVGYLRNLELVQEYQSQQAKAAAE